MSVIIPRNTKIPTKNTRSYRTVVDNQLYISIKIYEGEGHLVSDNIWLSTLELTGLRKAKAGEVINDVTFEVDENGILTVTAAERGTSNKSKISVSIYKNNLSEIEIQEMIDKAERFKIEDQKKKALSLLKNKLDEKCNLFKSKVQQITNMSTTDKNYISQTCEEAINWVGTNSNLKQIDIDKKIEQVEKKCTTIIEMYT